MQKFPLACYVFCLALELLLYLSGQLSVYIGKLWVRCNTGFLSARDNRVFNFYPTARETSGLMDVQEEHAPGRVVLWWHQGFVSTELLTGPSFIHRHKAGSNETRVLGSAGLGRGPGAQRPILSYLHSLFTLPKQLDEGSRGRANITAD